MAVSTVNMGASMLWITVVLMLAAVGRVKISIRVVKIGRGVIKEIVSSVEEERSEVNIDTGKVLITYEDV